MGKQKTSRDPQSAPADPSTPSTRVQPDQPDKVQLRERPTEITASTDELALNLPPPFALRAPAKKPAPTNRQAQKPLSKAGHRNRLRERFMQGGTDAMPDYELVELILFRAIPRRDTKDLAKTLLKRFGSFAEVINAPSERLKEIPGVGDAVIAELKLIHGAALRMMKSQINDRPVLSTWDRVINYIRAAQAYENRELFRILFLDKRNRLIADEIQGHGTVDHTPVYIREVVKRTLELSATAIILVHNHPSGDPTPSRADIEMTRHIADTAKPLGVIVHDHIIVGREGHKSFKALKLL